MPFQIRPLREFLVRPALPQALSRLSELAYNVLWSWDHTIRALFRRIDPALWRSCDHNPVLMLGRVPQATLERAATDPRFLALSRKACEVYDSYLHKSEPANSQKLIAYLSMEYGLAGCIPIYSGGLGILSGDHLKASSDGEGPLPGIGLLYQNGSFHQSLNQNGCRQTPNPLNDSYPLPANPVLLDAGSEILASATLPSGPA